MELLISGLGLHDVALLLNRMVLGGFFLLARFRWVWDPHLGGWFHPIRHESLRHKLSYCGLKSVHVWAPTVALIEIGAALMLLVGLFAPLAALGLLVILFRATHCTARDKTMRQNPVDKLDVVSCYLWTPEPIYIVLAIIALMFGAGAISLDTMILEKLL